MHSGGPSSESLLLPVMGASGSGSTGTPTSTAGPMCIYMKEHGKQLCENLQLLKMQGSLVDLDMVCEEQHLQVHKVVMAAASKFFKEQLGKANVTVPVIVRLEDFGLDVKREALGYIVDFIYRGEVVVPGEKLSDVCAAAHILGINGLTDFLPRHGSVAAVQTHLPPVRLKPTPTNSTVHPGGPILGLNNSSSASSSPMVIQEHHVPVVNLDERGEQLHLQGNQNMGSGASEHHASGFQSEEMHHVVVR